MSDTNQPLFSQVFHHAPIGMALVSLEGKFLSVNPALRDMLGYPEERLMQMTFQDITHPEDLQADLKHIQQVLHGNSASYQMHKRYLHQHGHHLWAQLHVSLVRKPDGTPDFFISQVQNLTELLQYQQHVETRNLELEVAHRMARLASFRIHQDVLYFSASIKHLLGHTVSAIPIEQLTGWFDATSTCHFVQALRETQTSKHSQNLEVQLLIPQGSTWRVHLSSKENEIWGIVQDITDLRKQQKENHELQERWTFALEGSQDGVWDFNIPERKVFFSERWKSMLGHQSHEIPERIEEWTARVHPDDLPRLMDTYQKHLDGESDHYTLQYRIRHKDGRYLWALVRGKVMQRTPEGEPVRVAGTQTDVTDMVQQAEALQQARDQLHTIINHMPGIIGYKDTDLRHQFGNEQYQYWYGKSTSEMQGLHIREVIGNQLYDLNHPHMQRALNGEIQQFEQSFVNPRGEQRHALFSYIPDWDGLLVRGFFVMGVDITEQKNSALQLEQQKEQMRTTLQSIGDGVISTDPHGQVSFMNPVAESMTGWTMEQARGKNVEQVMVLRDIHTEQTARNPLRLALSENRTVGMASDVVLISRNGEHYSIEDSAAPIWDTQGSLTGAVIVFHDVSESRAMAIKMSHLAQHDALTDLPNRVLLQDRISQAIQYYQRHDSRFAVVFVDLDHFKHINDSVGHQLGDAVLQKVARRMQNTLRAVDTVSRQGGDEFVLLLTEVNSSQDVEVIAERLIREVTQPYQVGEHTLHVTFSMGIAFYPDDGGDVDTLMKHADAAMYQAKKQGRNQYRFFAEDIRTEVETRTKLQKALQNALQNNEMVLHYQPKMDAQRQHLVGMEALLRWQRQDGTLVPPLQFIPLAEETGLILPIGHWVIREACNQCLSWHQQHGRWIPVAVNVSVLQFNDPQFLPSVLEALHTSCIPPECLELEITESLLMQDHLKAIRVLDELRKMGVKVSIDDFGTGYSSLSYLKRFAVDTVKIDRSFVRDLTSGTQDSAIISAVMGLSEALGFQVVAEGVETPEQVQTLLDLGCSVMQGYWFSRPMPKDLLGHLIQQES